MLNAALVVGVAPKNHIVAIPGVLQLSAVSIYWTDSTTFGQINSPSAHVNI